MREPTITKSTCQYCEGAPINHTMLYIENFITITLDGSTTKLVRYAPRFIKRLADIIPASFFRMLAFLGAVKFSTDIEKVASFRSRIIWEEAKRRGIDMEQVIFLNKPLDQYRATIGGKKVYFESIPIPARYLDMKKNWDDKITLKKEFSKQGIPVPKYHRITPWQIQSLRNIFSKFTTPVIVKPQVGSRARHTITHIKTLADLKEGVKIVRTISPYISVEEYLEGPVCRATVVGGKLAGFYRATTPFIIGDGSKTIRQLIEEKDASRPDRVALVRINDELHDHIKRFGYTIDDVLPKDVTLSLTHRIGRLFGGITREMINEVHPSFVPILEHAASVVDLGVAGFDCIIPDPTAPQDSQRWGIIECNTLPFIDLHYYALEGKPRNIAGMVWDMWN